MSPARPRNRLTTGAVGIALVAAGCGTDVRPSTGTPPATAAAGPSIEPTVAPSSARIEGRGGTAVELGEPIDEGELRGRIVFDDYEDVFSVDASGADLRRLTSEPGPEFDGSWSPDGQLVAYRDSRRGINNDDEIWVVAADGSDARNLTSHPANDWGPDWSPDGEWIVFNSDRDGSPLSGYLVRLDGTDLHRIETDAWFEYGSFSPDGTEIVFMGHAGGDYDLYVADVATGQTRRITDAPGSDGWPAWSPDGDWIAFSTERDDCLRAPEEEDCWNSGEPGEHHDIWLVRPDGADAHRVTPEFGQFVAWSPDGRFLLISGVTLYVVRPDGTGRFEFRLDALDLAPGGIPDWTE